MKWQFLTNQRGFTIIESLVTVGCLSIGFLGSFLVLQNNILNSVQADSNVKAVSLAQEKMEDILADISFLGYEYVVSDENYGLEKIDGGFTRVVNVAGVSKSDLESPEEGTGLNKVEVEVMWGHNEKQKITLTTLVSEGAIALAE